MLSSFLSVLLAIVSFVCALLLIGIILIQQNKAGGGLGAVSGGVTESMFGASAANVLTKATTWIAAVFLVSTLLLAASAGRFSRKNVSAAETAPTPAKTTPEVAAPAAEAAAEAAAAGTETKDKAATAVDEAGKAAEGAVKAAEGAVKNLADKADAAPAKDGAKAP